MGNICPGTSNGCPLQDKIKEKKQGICPLVTNQERDKYFSRKTAATNNKCSLISLKQLLPSEFICYDLGKQECLLRTKVLEKNFSKIFNQLEDVSSANAMNRRMTEFIKHNRTFVNQLLLEKVWNDI